MANKQGLLTETTWTRDRDRDRGAITPLGMQYNLLDALQLLLLLLLLVHLLLHLKRFNFNLPAECASSSPSAVFKSTRKNKTTARNRKWEPERERERKAGESERGRAAVAFASDAERGAVTTRNFFLFFFVNPQQRRESMKFALACEGKLNSCVSKVIQILCVPESQVKGRERERVREGKK